jgi:hypothetical protein
MESKLGRSERCLENRRSLTAWGSRPLLSADGELSRRGWPLFGRQSESERWLGDRDLSSPQTLWRVNSGGPGTDLKSDRV